MNIPISLPSRSTACLGDYTVIGVLGSGGNGVVLEAVLTHAADSSTSELVIPGTQSQKQVAIKCSAPGDDASAAVLEVSRQLHQGQ